MKRWIHLFLHYTELPPGYMLGFAALAWLQSKVLPLHLLGGLGDWVGGALVLLGLAVSGGAVLHFLLMRTSLIPRETPNKLVTSGLYRFSRNPIYLADAGILLGLILYWDALPSLILVPLFIKLIDWRFIRKEEAFIRERFGEQFEAYAAKVRRWL